MTKPDALMDEWTYDEFVCLLHNSLQLKVTQLDHIRCNQSQHITLQTINTQVEYVIDVHRCVSEEQCIYSDVFTQQAQDVVSLELLKHYRDILV